MITLYAFPFRSRAERILWLLQELELEHQVLRITPMQAKEICPSGKVPTIEHEGVFYSESLAIMEYLVAVAGRKDLIPSRADEVYRFRHFIYYLQSEVEAYLWLAEQNAALKAIYSWPEGTHAEAMKRVNRNIGQLYLAINADGFVCSRFSIADIYAYHVFTWAQSHAVALPEAVCAYLARLESRQLFPAAMKSQSGKTQ